MPEPSEDQKTAWHEAGHAVMAVWLGGRISDVTIDPDPSDGPRRSGEVVVYWPHNTNRVSGEIQEKAVLVALAGPVAEMIFVGELWHPGTVAEFADDWHAACHAAQSFVPADRLESYLKRATVQLHQILSSSDCWAAVGAVVDHLVAYGSLEGETVHEIVEHWSDSGHW